MKLLICIRQLPYSQPTIHFGGLIAGLEESPITLMTVVASEKERPQAEASLQNAKEFLDKPAVTSKVRKGSPIEEILNEARDGDYDIIVVGSRDMATLLNALLGSITEKVADRASACVLVVREDRPSLTRVLIPIGGQKMSRLVVEAGGRLAQEAGAPVTLLYVTEPVPTMYTGLEGIEETLPELLETDTPISRHLHWCSEHLVNLGVEAELKVKQGMASDEIMREARIGKYDLLVIGAGPVSVGLKRLLVDNVPHHIIEKAPCSVLVVR
jgi:nucleotide-binding universal stress UspA family protein